MAVLRTSGATAELILLGAAACLAVWVTRVSLEQHALAVDHGLAAIHWVLLAIVPLATALLIAVAARLTALFGLARLR